MDAAGKGSGANPRDTNRERRAADRGQFLPAFGMWNGDTAWKSAADMTCGML
jgi:hypothetical protein